MQYFESKRLREERQEVVSQIHELARKAKEENRELTAEEKEKFAKLETSQADYQSKIESAEMVERAEKLVVDTPEKPFKQVSRIITRQDHENALRAYALKQSGHYDLLSDELVRSAERVGLNLDSNSLKIRLKRTDNEELTTPSNAENSGLIQGVESAMLTYGQLRQAAQVVRTANGNVLPWVTEDDTSVEAAAHDKADTITSVTFTLNKVELGAYSFGSGVYPVAIETLQDTGINLTGLISDNLGKRIARKENSEHTVGGGTTGPKGLLTCITATEFFADTATPWYNVLVTLKNGVDAAYRNAPKAGFMFNDSILEELMMLVDGDDRPLWQTSLTVGEPDKILGKPYYINNDFYSMTDVGSPCILFGDLSKFIIRDVGEVLVMVLKERYAEVGAVGFVALHRTDSDCINTDALISAGVNTGSSITIT